MQMTGTKLKLLKQNGSVLPYVSGVFMNGHGVQARLDPGTETR